MRNSAVVVVDVQKDFCEGGSLAVQGGNEVAEKIKRFVKEVKGDQNIVVVFTRDWHVPGSDNGGHFSDHPDYADTWPHHCVQGTDGAEYHDALKEFADAKYAHFLKGMEKAAYSGFEGVLADDGQTTLAEFLRSQSVELVYVCGLAADYCVRATALDAVKEGFTTRILRQLTASISTPVEDVAMEVLKAQPTSVS